MSTVPASMTRHATWSRLARAGHSIAADGAIEWEELPSLVDELADRLVVLGRSKGANQTRARHGSGPAWDSTCPAALEPQRAPEPFHEPFNGLAIREVREPEVFRHFFGALAGR
jgi:hypothetical protein